MSEKKSYSLLKPSGERKTLEERRRTRKERYASYRVRKRSEERPSDFADTAKRLARMLFVKNPKMLIVILAAVSGTALTVIGPSLLGDAIDELQLQVQNKLAGTDLSFKAIGVIIVELFIVYGVSSLLSYIEQYTLAGVTQKIVCRLRDDINHKLTVLPLSFFDRHAKGEVLSRIMNDVDNISNTLQHNVVSIITSVVTIVGVFTVMLASNWKMTAVTVAVVPASVFIALKLSSYSKRLFREQWDRMGELNGHVEEMYSGHSIVKVFGQEQNAIDEFEEINTELYRVSRRAQFISGTIQPFISFINNVGYVLVCLIGGYYVVKGEFTLGGITMFITYSKMFTQPMVDLAQIANNIQSSLASSERVFSVLDEEEEPASLPPEGNMTFSDELVFDDVSFSYSPDKPLIEHMNLCVKAGQLVAIVGPTGAGKTTFVNLLMRFYDVCSGSITVDGRDVRDIPRDDLRGLFGMVLQDTWLFKGTIRENITYGRLDATEEEMLAAARSARANQFIRSLPDGYETVLDENGANLSQGQRQLITITRALLKNPQILILDEATSSVDTRTEMLVQQAMSEIMRGRTNFVIAHRLSTVRRADEILFIDNGTIKERGTHEELLEKGGLYADMYYSQWKGQAPKNKLETDF